MQTVSPFRRLFRLSGRGAIFLSYLLITFEMVFMITPFAVYYYSAYSPVLGWLSVFPATSWAPAFFLPHLSTEVVPGIGGVILIIGLAGFLFNAFQLYYAKFKRRGVVKVRFYRRIRHPQYLFLAIAGLGLVIIWPRFIVLMAYITMLLLYYLLARDEERRMESSYGDAYSEYKLRTSMFLPGEPGGRMAGRLFNWIDNRALRLLVIYLASLAAAVSVAFALRASSLSLTMHLSLPDRKIAAVSFLSGDGQRLQELVEAALASEQIQNQLQIKRLNDWLLVHTVEGKGRVVHLMIDAGMTRQRSQNLPLAKEGIKLVFSRRENGASHNKPFSAAALWRPIFIAELEEGKMSKVLELDPHQFPGNPTMPLF